MATTVRGNLLTSACDAIVQQCNCVTMISQGLSATIATEFPYADVYSRRTAKSRNTATSATRGIPGDLVLCRPPDRKAGPVVACLMSQICPGKPGQWAERYGVLNSTDDGPSRLRYFKESLHKLRLTAEEEHWQTIGFPDHIGCGLAGGNWIFYKRAIDEIAEGLKCKQVAVYIFSL